MSEELEKPNRTKKESITAQFARYVSLNVLGMIGVSCNILADTFFIANGVGAEGLAGLNFALVLFSLMTACGLMLGVGGATKFQLYKALDQHKEANQTFMNTLFMGVCVSAILVIGVAGFATPISYFLGADEVIVKYTDIYLRTLFSFAPFFIFDNIIRAFTRNDGSPHIAMAATLTGSLANIVLDYTFIFIFDWGMFGAAFATGLSPLFSLIVASIHIFTKKNTFHFVKAKLSASLMRTIAALGFSSMIVDLSSGVVLFVFNLVILHFEGNIGVAAYGVVANIALVVTALFVGIAQGMQPLSSRSYALGDAVNLRKVLRYAVLTSVAIAAVTFAVVMVWAEPLAAAFNRDNDPVLAALAVEGMRIYFFGYFFAGVNIVVAAFFSSVEAPAQGFLISIMRGFVMLLTMVVVFAQLLGMIGVWMSFPAAELATVILTTILLVVFLRKGGAPRVRAKQE